MAPPPPKPEKDNAERWLLTYADLITLLLIFFIIMYVMSIQDIVKFKSVAQSLNMALAGGGQSIMGEAPASSLIPGQQGYQAKYNKDKSKSGSEDKKRKSESETMAEIKQKIEQMAKAAGLETKVTVTQTERGVTISIIDKLLFSSGEASLSPSAHSLLQKIGSIISVSQQYMRVEGHTDNQPISSFPYPSNWELSAARATNVVRMFIEESGITPERLSAVGYGEYRPIASNATEEGRMANRRVEIVLLDSKFNRSEAGAESSEAGATPAAGLLSSPPPSDQSPVGAQTQQNGDVSTPPAPQTSPKSEFQDDFFEKELGGGK